MTYKWLIDAIARVDIDGKPEILYQGLEFKVLEDNEYINFCISLGWVEPIAVVEPTEPIEEAV